MKKINRYLEVQGDTYASKCCIDLEDIRVFRHMDRIHDRTYVEFHGQTEKDEYLEVMIPYPEFKKIMETYHRKEKQ